MTRLTNEMRDTIIGKALANLPKQDFHAEARVVIEKAIYDAAPTPVRALLDDDALRHALAEIMIDVRVGNRSVLFYTNGSGFRGIVDRVVRPAYRPAAIHMGDASANKGTFAAIYTALRQSGVVDRAVSAEDTLKAVSARLKSAVYGVTTVKRLYDVLEPELHHLIPKAALGAGLPVVSVKVADDLRKLGADLPVVPARDAAE